MPLTSTHHLSLLVPASITVKEAMKKLNTTAEKILFVIDDTDRLLGAITDGDIRRWILEDQPLTAAIDRLYNRNPISVTHPYDLATVKHMMLEKKLDCIPVVDTSFHIIDILFWTQIFDTDPQKISYPPLGIPIVVMAGGFGTRLEPFTKILPKPLIPIGDKSVLEIIIDQFLAYDVTKIHLSVNHKSKIIKSYFEELNPPYEMSYIYEDRPLGTAGALAQFKTQFDGPFLLTNCDVIIKQNYHDILDFHQKNDFDITMVASMKNYQIPYGICEIESGGELVSIKEKPEYTFLVNTGMYIINSNLLSLIPADELFHMTHFMEKVKETGGRVGVFPISETAWIDTGEWHEYRQAVELLKR